MANTLQQHDIVIIGAGPAGCATSMFLSRLKIPHTIIDKAVFPRDKICGDALSGKVVYVFKQLDESLLSHFSNQAHKFLPSWGVQFVAPNGKAIDIPFRSNRSVEKHAPGFISRRLDFDDTLFNMLDPTYASIHQATVLNKTEQTAAGLNLHCATVPGNSAVVFNNVKMVVGAEGDRSVIGKELGMIKKENEHYCAGIRAYYNGVTGLHDQNFIELHFLEELLPGYFWIFPLPNGRANVGAGMLSATVSKKKG